MEPTTDGTFRVLPGRPGGSGVVLLDVDGYEPVVVETDGYGDDLAERVAALRPGYLVSATLAWSDGNARFEDLAVEVCTLYEFVEGVSGLFEAALDTWAAARRDGEAVGSRVTRGTDGEPNGVVYTFADQPGETDVFAEFRDGRRPVEPLVERTGEAADRPGEVFVMRPVSGGFVVVFVVLRKGSRAADVVRDTYGCPRPGEVDAPT